MNDVILDFNTRAKEVHDYFIFIESLLQETTKLVEVDSAGNHTNKTLDPELAKTLKANGFLLLYNLVESTMRNAIEAIFENLKNQRVSFDHLKPEITLIVLQNLKNHSPDQIYLTINELSKDIITATFDPKKLFSGNVDAKKIKEIADKYGFSCQTNAQNTKNGEKLLVVKSNRNDLAHGIKSFEEVGRDKTIEELLKIKEEVVEYLRQILENIRDYLDNEEYLGLCTANP